MVREKIKKIKGVHYLWKGVKKTDNYVRYLISLKYILNNYKRVKAKINEGQKLNIVFVIQYIPGWNKMKPIYEKMLNDSRFNPIIVCVPLNIQNNKPKIDENDTYQYFVTNGYKAINAFIDGKWFALETLKPDYLFHSRPYNSYLPKEYSSEKIVKYSLICNVMYGANFSYNEQDVTLNKDYYKNVFLYYSFDENEANFYSKRFKRGIKRNIQRVLPYGAIGLEQILNSKFDYQDSKFDKTILWTPRWSTDTYIGGSNFFNYKYIILKLAKDYPKVKFILRPHPLMFGNFIKTGQMSVEEVEDFKKYIKEENNLELDESKEYSDIFWKSDFIIADLSGIVPEYFVTGKPMIYCHSSATFNYVDYSKAIIESSYPVYNSTELVDIVIKLINNQDEKETERKKCFDKYFNDVRNNSANIIESLLKI